MFSELFFYPIFEIIFSDCLFFAEANMSGGHDCLAITEDDITKMLAATTHIGSDNSETTMEQYIFKKKTDGINIINIKKTWEKLLLAARAIAAIENPQDVFVVTTNTSWGFSIAAIARAASSNFSQVFLMLMMLIPSVFFLKMYCSMVVSLLSDPIWVVAANILVMSSSVIAKQS